MKHPFLSIAYVYVTGIARIPLLSGPVAGLWGGFVYSSLGRPVCLEGRLELDYL